MGNQEKAMDGPLKIKIGGDPADRKRKKYNEDNRVKSTKYNLVTFLPQNLLEQFRRVINFYFLVMVTLTIVLESLISPLASVIPFLFVISLTATKQGYEDYLRHKADNIVNFALVKVLREGKEEDVYCQDIVEGDLVLVARNGDVPCDIVLLKSSDPNGRCFVTTANLDGETSLKTHSVPKALPNVEVDKLHTLGVIECEQSNTNLYCFNGKIELASSHRVQSPNRMGINEVGSRTIPLINENILLRGSRVKNTEQVIGCAVYTGQNTKVALNSKLTQNKRASSENYINKFIIFVFSLLIGLATIACLMKRYYDIHVIKDHTYLGPSADTQSVGAFFQDFSSFIMLLKYLIPISLYITVEMNKFLGSFFMEWDIQLYDDKTDQPCIVNTSDLNEDLGQINVLFSDKTGTLTKNEMSLQQCSIKGRKYKFNGETIEEEKAHIPFKLSAFDSDQKEFFQALALCHTVQVGGWLEKTESENQSIYMHTNNMEKSVGSTRLYSEYYEPNLVQLRNIQRNLRNGVDAMIDEECLQNPLGKRVDAEIHNHLKDRLTKISIGTDGLKSQRNGALNNYTDSNFYTGRSTSMTKKSSIPGGRTMIFRSISSIGDLMESRHHYRTRPRAQSCGAPSAFPQQTSLIRNFHWLLRSPSTRSRESYAAPSFTGSPFYTPILSDRKRNETQIILDKLDYQASSPDENALVEACAQLGIFFAGENNDILTLNEENHHEGTFIAPFGHVTQSFFRRLHVLEFSSDRKRMSVMVQDQKGEIWVYTKGAESAVFPLCNRQSEHLIAETTNHSTDFSRQGLRTLAIARRKMSLEEYENVFNAIAKANSSLTDRQKQLEVVYATIEKDLDLLGCTAVEDALQDHVKETFVALQGAGIKVWVLTGDKVETAHNVAISCGHIPHDSETYYITECRDAETVLGHLCALETEQKRRPNDSFALLIDGKSFAIALSEHPGKMREVGLKCKAVLCCRLSPLQKSQVVKLVKSGKEGYITAAIGDGANDVSMIQKAHIGIGIVGKEGRQAARCADIAFGNFNMLQRLLLVHGHCYSRRFSLLLLYFFYKNCVSMCMEFFFQFNCLFSSTPIYDSLFLTLFNITHSTLPIIVLSLTEKPYHEALLKSQPALYKKNIFNRRLHWKFFIGWMLLGIYHALIVYTFGYGIWNGNDAIFTTPYTASLSCFATFLMHNVVIVVNLKLWMEAIYQSYIFIASIWLSILCFIIISLIQTLIFFPEGNEMYYVYNGLMSSTTFWLLSIITVIAALLPDYVLIIFSRVFRFHKEIRAFFH